MRLRRARDLKLTSFVATPVRMTYQPPFASRAQAGVKYIVRAGTSKGLVGIGETEPGVSAGQLERHARRLLEIDFDDLIVNRLPLPHDEAYGAFELAIYDILGLELRVPVYQLLGDSCRDRVACAWPVAADHEHIAPQVAQGVEAGFTTMLVAGDEPAELVRTCQAVHEAARGRASLWVRLTKALPGAAQAVAFLQALQPFSVRGVENLCKQMHLAALQARRDTIADGGVALCMPMHLALERSDGPAGEAGKAMLGLMTAGLADGFHIRHDLAPFVRLADMVSLAGLSCRHGSADDSEVNRWPADFGILEAAHVHAAAAAPACVWPSHLFGRSVLEHDLLARPLSFSQGHLEVPQRPGLGIRLDIHAMERCRAGEDLVIDHRS